MYFPMAFFWTLLIQYLLFHVLFLQPIHFTHECKEIIFDLRRKRERQDKKAAECPPVQCISGNILSCVLKWKRNSC